MSGTSTRSAAAAIALTLLAWPSVVDGGEENEGTIKVSVQGLRSSDGQVLLFLYDSKKGFPTKPSKAKRRLEAKIEKKKAGARFTSVPHGMYAVSVVHDEDGDGKVDTYILGIPKEGVGVSNNPKAKAGPPKFDDAKFALDSDRIDLIIKVKYL